MRSFAGGQFLFTLDGSGANPGFIRSVSGGSVKGKILQEEVGPDHVLFKHLGAVEIEPLTLELGMALSKPVLEWIKDSWKRSYSRRNGHIVHADSDYRARLRQEFKEALITETKFPALDGSTKEPAYLTISIHPEALEISREGGEQIRGRVVPQQKLWTPSSFRLHIEGIDTSHANKIESFSVKQKIKPLYFGSARFPEIEPTGIEYDNLTVYLALEHADDFIKWHHQYVVRGDKDTRQERDGYIEFLSPKGDQVLFTVSLTRLGIFSLSIDKSQAGQEEIKRCKVELYVETMGIEYGSGVA